MSREPKETLRNIETLVTCKDCKYGKAIEEIGCIKFSHVEPRLQPKDPDGFCAWAERG